MFSEKVDSSFLKNWNQFFSENVFHFSQKTWTCFFKKFWSKLGGRFLLIRDQKFQKKLFQIPRNFDFIFSEKVDSSFLKKLIQVFTKSWLTFSEKVDSSFSENLSPLFQKTWTIFSRKNEPVLVGFSSTLGQSVVRHGAVGAGTLPDGVVEIGCSGYCHNLDYMGPLPKKNRPCGALQKLASHQPAGCGTTVEKYRQKLHFRRGSFPTFALKHFGWQATRKSKSSPVLFFPSPPSK